MSIIRNIYYLYQISKCKKIKLMFNIRLPASLYLLFQFSMDVIFFCFSRWKLSLFTNIASFSWPFPGTCPVAQQGKACKFQRKSRVFN
jgi:hypothetical protein